MPTEPEPAPRSHSSSPRRGASAGSVTARTSRLVIWPSCSNASSDRPAASGITAPRGPDHLDGERVQGGTAGSSRGPEAVAPETDADLTGCARAGRPSPPARAAPKRQSRAWPERRDGGGRPRVGATGPPRARRAGAAARNASSGRPQNEIVAQSCSAQPRRAQASENADGAGRHSVSATGTCRASSVPTPKQWGSPEASTTVGAGRRARMAGTAASIGRGHASRPPWIRSRARSRCRAPPTTSVAASIRPRASGERSATPPSPMPRMVNQRALMLSGRHEGPDPRRHHRSLGPGARAGGRAGHRGRAVARGPDARAGPAGGRRAPGRVRGRGRTGALPARGRDRRTGGRDASVRGADVAPCAGRIRPGRRAPDRDRAAALASAAGRQLASRRRHARGGRRPGAASAPRVPDGGATGAGAVRRARPGTTT